MFNPVIQTTREFDEIVDGIKLSFAMCCLLSSNEMESHMLKFHCNLNRENRSKGNEHQLPVAITISTRGFGFEVCG